MRYAIYAMLAWNLIVFLLYGLDKRKAIKNKWRISENTLLISAFLMGSLGAFAGMKVFRHKTHNLKFKIGVPLAIIINIALVVLIHYVMKVDFS